MKHLSLQKQGKDASGDGGSPSFHIQIQEDDSSITTDFHNVVQLTACHPDIINGNQGSSFIITCVRNYVLFWKHNSFDQKSASSDKDSASKTSKTHCSDTYEEYTYSQSARLFLLPLRFCGFLLHFVGSWSWSFNAEISR